jgi:hypothetical protein
MISEMVESTSEQSTLGAGFARALAEKDADRLRGLLATQLDFQAMTPRRTWQAQDPDGVVEVVFGNWFDAGDRIESVEMLETERFADRERVGYRLSVSNSEGRFLVEQQAYLSAGDARVEDGPRIAWMRVLCSGFRPVEP